MGWNKVLLLLLLLLLLCFIWSSIEEKQIPSQKYSSFWQNVPLQQHITSNKSSYILYSISVNVYKCSYCFRFSYTFKTFIVFSPGDRTYDSTYIQSTTDEKPVTKDVNIITLKKPTSVLLEEPWTSFPPSFSFWSWDTPSFWLSVTKTLATQRTIVRMDTSSRSRIFFKADLQNNRDKSTVVAARIPKKYSWSIYDTIYYEN